MIADSQIELSQEGVCDRCGKKFFYQYKENYRYRYKRMENYRALESWYCSWTCFRRGKIEDILAKKSLNRDDVLYLRNERVPIPVEKLAKHLKRELSDIL